MALKNKQAADSRALALASTIRELMATGFVSQQALTDELNRRGVPTALGGSWHRASVRNMLTRLGLITKGTVNNGLANKTAADARAKTLASTVRALQVRGLVSLGAIARELNAREIRTGRAANGTQAALADCCTAWISWSLPRELLSLPTSDGEPSQRCSDGRLFSPSEAYCQEAVALG